MAQYLFGCTTCPAEIEKIQKVDDPFPKCEKCGADTRRLIAPSNFRLKGGCWAYDGYRGKEPVPFNAKL